VVIVLAAVTVALVVTVNNLDLGGFKAEIGTVVVLIIGTVGLVGLIAFVSLAFRRYAPKGMAMGPATPSDPTSAQMSGRDRGTPLWPLVIVAAVIMVLAGVAAVLVIAINQLHKQALTPEPEITTATVLIIGTIGLLSVIAVLVVVFRHYDPEGATGALGLPDGSVQAVIALALILIFALFGVYLHGQAGSPELRQQGCLTRGQVSVIPSGTVVRVKAERWRRGSACSRPAPKPVVRNAPSGAGARARRRVRRANRRAAAAAARNTVVRYRVTVAVPNAERENIPTQLLSIIGTLVVAAAGF